MRVLLLCPGMHPREGGPPRVVTGSAVALVQAGVAVEIATIGRPEEEAETRARWPELAQAGIPLHIFPRDFPWAIGWSRELKRFCHDAVDRFDLVHIHCIWETALANGAAIFRGAGKPTFISAHGMLDHWQMQRSALKKTLAQHFLGTGAMLQNATALVYGTQDEATEAMPLGLTPRVAVIANGVDPDGTIDPDAYRERLLARVPVARDWRRTVLFFSRLHPKKGLNLLIEAFGRVQSDFPDVGLLAAVIPEDETHRVAICDQIAALGSVNIVLISEPFGFDPNEVFAAADIFCLPSHQEGFSMAIIQAASAGLAQLVTDKCHVPEIEACGAGYVVPDTVEGIEHGLRKLLAMDDATLSETGLRARRLVLDNYTWDRIAEKLIRTYRSIVAPSHS